MKHATSLFAIAAMTALSMTGVKADDLRDRQVAACSGDAMRLCSDAIPDEAKVTSCMMARKPDLSAGCRALFIDASTGDNSAPKASRVSRQSASVR
jgi:hypothetical protein